MVWVEREVQSRTDYILGTDFCLFQNVVVWEPRHKSDHYLILGCLHSSPLREHKDCLGRHKIPPHLPPVHPNNGGGLFADLGRSILKPKALEARKNA